MTNTAIRSLVKWDQWINAVKSNYGKIITKCYTPTNNAEDEIMDTFYNKLQELRNKVSKHGKLIVMGENNNEREARSLC